MLYNGLGKTWENPPSVGYVCYCSHMDNYCCWNKKNGFPLHNGDCFTAHGPVNRNAAMAVTFTDGKTIIYKNVRVCVNRFDNDGIDVDGTTVKFETADGTCFTLVGVRQYVYEIDDDL